MTASAVRARPPLFAGSVVVPHEGFVFELMPENAGRRDLLASVQDQVVTIAARSRGWDSAEDLAHFRRVFKLDSLFHADGLVLIWHDGRLAGLAGLSYDLPAGDNLILHVGSLGLLPGAQNRGFLPVMFALLWDTLLGSPRMRQPIDSGRAYLTAITQSPYILSFFDAVSDLYPRPGALAPDPAVREVADRVVAVFEPGVAFDPRTFILRNECEFFYRRIPYGQNREINEFCDRQLRYGEGDTFMAVGRVRPASVRAFLLGVRRNHAGLFTALRAALAETTYSWKGA